MTEPSQEPTSAAPKSTRDWTAGLSTLDDRALLSGAQRRSDDVVRTLKIAGEFLKGFHAFRDVSDCVTFFGSARFSDDHPYYKLARETGRAFAEAGFTVMTGGGPGIMEAGNRGAKEGGGRSIACNIKLPKEQQPNPYLDRWIEMHYFFVRKVMLVKFSEAFVLFPGGYGTMDEIFEVGTLIQTGKIARFPAVLMGEDYWRYLLPFIRETMLRAGTVSEADLNLAFQTEDPDEAVRYVREHRHRVHGR